MIHNNEEISKDRKLRYLITEKNYYVDLLIDFNEFHSQVILIENGLITDEKIIKSIRNELANRAVEITKGYFKIETTADIQYIKYCQNILAATIISLDNKKFPNSDLETYCTEIAAFTKEVEEHLNELNDEIKELSLSK